MKINDAHMFHGSALTQIAEHPQFTAINGVRIGTKLSRCAFRVNDSIGVYLKYASEPILPHNDYIFTFGLDAKKELKWLFDVCDRVFVVLVCVDDRQICCISYEEFDNWIKQRQQKLQKRENTSTILVNLPKGKSFRVNMNEPGRRNLYLKDAQLVTRNRFPGALFE